jgi:corrinoid protein of di/trimethylamine methyltransferase
MEDFLKECEQAVLEGDAERAAELASRVVEGEGDIMEAIEEGFVPGIREVGRLWSEGKYFLPELVMGAEAVKKALSILEPALAAGKMARKTRGIGILGTVEGDIHDIGKTLVSTMLSARGYEVHDLGTDVPAGRFVEEAQERGADFIGASALLTTTMTAQKGIIELLESRGEREKCLVIVGGAPCSGDWAESIGADGYAADAVSAVALLERLLGKGEGGSS